MNMMQTKTGGLAMQFTQSELTTLTNALHCAGQEYQRISQELKESNPSLSQQFDRQYIAAITLADLIEQE